VRSLMGEQDLRLYGEVAVLGLQNTAAYKYYIDTATGITDTTRVVYDSTMSYYNDITKRIPIMAGFDLPCFKILDYLSVEMEWYGWPYPNSLYQGGFVIPMPQPAKAQNVPDAFYLHDNWKFSINAKRTFFNSFSIIAQIARDHSRHDIFAPSKQAQNTGEETLSKPSSFGWWLKLQFKF